MRGRGRAAARCRAAEPPAPRGCAAREVRLAVAGIPSPRHHTAKRSGVQRRARRTRRRPEMSTTWQALRGHAERVYRRVWQVAGSRRADPRAAREGAADPRPPARVRRDRLRSLDAGAGRSRAPHGRAASTPAISTRQASDALRERSRDVAREVDLPRRRQPRRASPQIAARHGRDRLRAARLRALGHAHAARVPAARAALRSRLAAC